MVNKLSKLSLTVIFAPMLVNKKAGETQVVHNNCANLLWCFVCFDWDSCDNFKNCVMLSWVYSFRQIVWYSEIYSLYNSIQLSPFIISYYSWADRRHCCYEKSFPFIGAVWVFLLLNPFHSHISHYICMIVVYWMIFFLLLWWSPVVALCINHVFFFMILNNILN